MSYSSSRISLGNLQIQCKITCVSPLLVPGSYNPCQLLSHRSRARSKHCRPILPLIHLPGLWSRMFLHWQNLNDKPVEITISQHSIQSETGQKVIETRSDSKLAFHDYVKQIQTKLNGMGIPFRYTFK